MKKILIISLALSIVSFANFIELNGVVTDSQTNLSWQNDYTDNAGNIKSASWTGALAYCKALNLDGLGWRLPNIKELTTIIDDTSTNMVKTNTVLSLIGQNNYWTATTYSNTTTSAWIVSFDTGNQNTRVKTQSNYVICVRGGR